MTYILIYGETARRMEVGETDVIAVHAEASLIVAEPDWIAMCKEAGGEDVLMAEMGVKWEEDDVISESE
jgi:hypothetical protein